MEASFPQLSLVFSSRRDLQTAASALNWFQARCSPQTLRRLQPALSLSLSLAPPPAGGIRQPTRRRPRLLPTHLTVAGLWGCLRDFGGDVISSSSSPCTLAMKVTISTSDADMKKTVIVEAMNEIISLKCSSKFCPVRLVRASSSLNAQNLSQNTAVKKFFFSSDVTVSWAQCLLTRGLTDSERFLAVGRVFSRCQHRPDGGQRSKLLWMTFCLGS